MAVPSLTRTWQFQVNQNNAATGVLLSTVRALLRAIKNSLIGLGSWTDSLGGPTSSGSNWTVSGSSNASVAALDGVDRWAADTDITWANAGVAHSWIVLRQTGIATNYEVLIDCTNVTPSNLTLVISPSAGFTGGSTTARPTATDEIVLLNSAAWGAPASDATSRLHVMKTALGRSTRVVISRSSQAVALWVFEVPTEVVSGWNNPSFAFAVAVSTAAPASKALTYNTFGASAIANGRGVSSMTMFLTGEGTRASGLIGEAMPQQSDFSGNYAFLPIGLHSDTVSNKGRHGAVVDLWWGVSTLVDTTTYPIDGTKQFVQIGVLIFPWNRSVPIFV